MKKWVKAFTETQADDCIPYHKILIRSYETNQAWLVHRFLCNCQIDENGDKWFEVGEKEKYKGE